MESRQARKLEKLNTYDSSTKVPDQPDEDEEVSQTMLAETPADVNEDEMIETLVMEGDSVAILIADFEAAASDVLQGDEELASALNA